MYFSIEEYQDRWARVHREMQERGFAAALIWSRSGGTYERHGDVLYTTGYYSSASGNAPDIVGPGGGWQLNGYSAVLMVPGEVPELICDSPEYPLALIATDRVSWPRSANMADEAVRTLRDRGISGPVAFVGSEFFPVKHMAALERGLPDVEFVPCDDLVASVRRFKSPRELDCYREAGQNASAAMTALMTAAIVPGTTQAGAAAAGAAELIRRGGVPHMIPIASGDTIGESFATSPLPGFSKDTVLREGDLVRAFIYGPMLEGYWLDPGRTAVVGGKPTAEQKELIGHTIRIIDTLIEKVRPGVAFDEVILLGHQLRSELGEFQDAASRLFSTFGHGIGLFWEYPQLDVGAIRDDGSPLGTFHEGQTLGLEIFLATEAGSAGLEQNIIVGAERNEILTTTPVQWW